jgi:PAS domain S-box-containing protein
VNVRVAVGVWTLGLLAAGGGVAYLISTGEPDTFTVRAALGIATALLFVAAGLITWLARPENRTGAIMVLVGFTWFLPVLGEAENPYVYGLGASLNDLPWAAFGLLVLSYPTGRLEDRASRLAVGLAFFIALVLRPCWVFFGDLEEYHRGGPRNGLKLSEQPGLESAFLLAIQIAALIAIAAALVILVQRWRSATPALRRTLTPVYLSFGVSVGILAVTVFLQAIGNDLNEALYWGALASLVLVPVAFAVGLLRTRLAQAGVGRLLVELDHSPEARTLQESLGRALGDPSLEVAYWLPDQEAFVDRDGNPLPQPLAEGDRRATVVERRGEPVAALVHDVQLLNDPGLLEAVGAAAGLSLENERRLAELKRSQARLRALVDALPDLMFRLRSDGTYLAVQAHDKDLLAAPPDELIGRTVHEVLPEEAAGRIAGAIERLGPDNSLETVEYELDLEGGVRHFEARLSPIAADEAVLVVRDITERRERELQVRRLQTQLEVRLEELNRERELVRGVVQSSPSFFCVLEEAGRVVRFNRALERASGLLDGDETRGKAFWELFPLPEEADEVRDVIVDAFQRNQATPERENRWRAAADGSSMDVAWALTPLHADGPDQPFLVTGMDVTDRTRHEAELRSSRARIVEAASVERRRLERNLHDGAQQRLVSLSLFIRLALGKVREDPDGAEALLTNASDELARALEELRELARGIHPAVLTDRGLEPALLSLVTRVPVPVTVAEAPKDRLPEPVEAAAYYVVAEALTNVAKYANANAATVRVSRDNGRAVVEVADDGIGGADATRGSGLRGLADRVEALDGTLHVTSPPGGGTTIRAEIPVEG